MFGADNVGEREPRTIPTKDLPHRVVLFGGWCANCRNLRKRQNTHHPQFCTRDVDRPFCGGGAWISRSEIHNLPCLEGAFRVLSSTWRDWFANVLVQAKRNSLCLFSKAQQRHEHFLNWSTLQSILALLLKDS